MLKITADGPEFVRFSIPAAPTRDGAQRLHLESGLWTGFRARPFGRIPDPGGVPDAIFVTAIDTHPLVADPRAVLAESRGAIARGSSSSCS